MDRPRCDKCINSGFSHWDIMKGEKPLELRSQCLNCYKTFKGDDCVQRALDCCGSLTQTWYVNYNRWGKQKWYGR